MTKQEIEVIFGSKKISLNKLEPALMKAFCRLYQFEIANCGLDPDQVEKEMKEQSATFFDKWRDSPDMHEYYFQNFSPIWNWHHAEGRHRKSERIMKVALKYANSYEAENKGVFIHKATPYFLMAISLFEGGDYENAFAQLRKALAEDERINKVPRTPACATIMLDDSIEENVYRLWVAERAKNIKILIEIYNRKCELSFTYEAFRSALMSDNLFDDSSRIVLLYAIVKTERIAAWISHSNDISEFYSTLYFEALISLMASIETCASNAIARIDGQSPLYFSDKIKEFCRRHLGECETGNIFNIYKKNNDKLRGLSGNTTRAELAICFKKCIIGICENEKLSNIEKDISITAILRNRMAHDGFRIDAEMQGEIITSVFNTLFFVIQKSAMD